MWVPFRRRSILGVAKEQARRAEGPAEQLSAEEIVEELLKALREKREASPNTCETRSDRYGLQMAIDSLATPCKIRIDAILTAAKIVGREDLLDDLIAVESPQQGRFPRLLWRR